MLFARVQDQLANPAITAMGWCADSANGERLAYRVLRSSQTTASSFGKISHLSVTKPARLGNPEDRP